MKLHLAIRPQTLFFRLRRMAIGYLVVATLVFHLCPIVPAYPLAAADRDTPDSEDYKSLEATVSKHVTDLSFNAQSLDFAVRDLEKKVADALPLLPYKFQIKIIGDDLKLDGLTRNMTLRDFRSEGTIAKILTDLVMKTTTAKDPKSPELKLIWIIGQPPDEGGPPCILLTTRQMAAKRKNKIPLVFDPQAKPELEAEQPKPTKPIETVFDLDKVDEILSRFKTRFTFQAKTLEMAVQGLESDIQRRQQLIREKFNIKSDDHFKIKIMSEDLKLDGITRNMTIRDFDCQGSVAEILTAIVMKTTIAKAPSSSELKLIWLVDKDPDNPRKNCILLTTRQMAARRSQPIPLTFVVADLWQLLAKHPQNTAFEAQSLDFALEDLEKSVKKAVPSLPFEFKIKILEDDLKLEGVTRNFTIRDFHTQGTIADVLTAMVMQTTTAEDPTSPDLKVIWVVGNDPDDPQIQKILITTRLMAAKRKNKVPDVFVAK